MKLTIVVEFKEDLSPQGQQHVKDAVQTFKETLFLGTVTKAELVTTS